MSDKKAQTRERILAAASAALLQRGPAEPSVGEVMGAAGLTVGGFYAHFDSKDALMLEVFQQMLSQRRKWRCLVQRRGFGAVPSRHGLRLFGADCG